MNDKDDKTLAQSYEKMASKARELFSESSEKTLEALETAIEAAREHFVKVGDITQKESAHLKYYLRRDLEQSAKHFHTLSEQAKIKLKSENLQAGFLDLTAQLAHGASDLFSRLAEWAESGSSYHTGQVTAPGVLRCRQCGKEMHFKKTGNIPPCSGCRGTDFVRESCSTSE
ncbi:zinc ribbon-containing protein [Teredinibacter haidensis]|uniref:zinc ribbon-containing protein n=1 Tax=Teredinibacter haidensis TaxID=2731755 RepID=UPI000948D37D|nr:zinc ribbon-containing protein [Teredinibacter haidensis]